MALKRGVCPARMHSPFSCGSEPLSKSSTDTNLFEMAIDMKPCLFLAQISAFRDTGHLTVCLRDIAKGC